MPDIRLANVVVETDIQCRARSLDQGHVEDLAAALTAGAKLPPVVVYKTPDGTLYLSEGFHRVEAYRRAGRDFVTAEVRDGTRDDAKLNAMASNQGHGLKRTNEDKRRAASEVLKLKPEWSDRRIAEHIGVSGEFIRQMREQVPTVGTSTEPKREGKDGKTYPKTQPAKPKPARPQEVTAEPVNQPESEPAGDTVQKDKDDDEDDVTVIGDDLPDTVASEYDPILPQREPPPPTGTPVLPGLDDYQANVSQVVKEVVATRPRWDAVLRKVREVVEELDTLATGPSGEHLRNLADGEGVKLWQSKVIRKRNISQRMTVFEPLLHLLRMIRHSRPAKVCDGCRGHGCRECRHAGYIPYGPLPKLDKAGTLFTIDLDPWED